MIIALTQWLISTLIGVDKLFFSYDHITHYYVLVKILYGLALIIFWCFIFDFFRKIASHDSTSIRKLKTFLFYSLVMSIYMIILWPGTWSLDDLMTILNISSYNSFFPWQGIITGVYQDVLLQILPFPGGIIILQNIIISMCVAGIISSLELTFNIFFFKNEIGDQIFKIIPFCILPPVIMYQFSGYRIGIYIYLELLMLVKLLEINRTQYDWSFRNIFFLSFLCVLVPIWRTESILYIPFSILMILISQSKPFFYYKKLICILLICISAFGINKWQKSELGDSNYQLISLLCPCAELVRAADLEEDADSLKAIDKVTDVKIILDNINLNGEYLFWTTDCVRESYSHEEYVDFTKALIKLSIKYPKVVAIERMNQFIRATNLNGRTVYNDDSAYIFDNDCDNEYQLAVYEKNWIAYKPLLPNIRTIVINILSGKSISGIRIDPLCRVMWNGLIPIVILIYIWLKLLFKRQWYYWFLCTSVVTKIPIVILTEPAGWLMYLLSFYFIEYVCLIYSFRGYKYAK